MFVAEEKHHELVKDIPEGVIVAKGSESEGEATMTAVSNVRTTNDDPSMSLPPGLSSSAPVAGGGAPTWSTGGATSSGNQMVGFTPLSTNYPNMNPALNAAVPGGATRDVQILNTLEAQPTNSLENYSMADSVLDAIPGSMFDWGNVFLYLLWLLGILNFVVYSDQWGNFFARFGPNVALFHQQQQQQAAAAANAQQQQNQPQQGPYPYGT